MDQNQQNQKNIDWTQGGFPTWGKMLVAVAVVLLLMLVFFRVRTFEVTGNVRYSLEEISEASGLAEGDILMGVNKTSTASRLLVKLPYLEEVVIEKALPGTIRFSVKECAAAALTTSEFSTYWLINEEGKLLEEIENPDESTYSAYPLITGTVVTMPTGGETAEFDNETKGEIAMEVLSAVIDTSLSGKVSEIVLAEDGSVNLIYDSRIEVRLGDGSDAMYKLQYLKAVVEEISEGQKGALDLSFSTGETAIFHPIA